MKAGSTLNPHKWTVECRKYEGIGRPRHGAVTRFVVRDPVHMCDDNDLVKVFDTFGEAIGFAQREAFRADLVAKFEDYLNANQNPTSSPDYDHTGLDTMYRLFRWWGRYDLADLLENI